MTARDIRVSGRPTRIYGVRDFVRDELAERPLRPRDVLAFLVGLALIVALVVLVLAGGQG